jgi:hypothetical protein
MADNLKVEVEVTFSENADYDDPEWVSDIDPFEIDPEEAFQLKVRAATGGTTLNLTDLDLTSGTGALLVVKNTDPSNYVQVAWTDISGTACVARIQAGGILVVPNMNPGTNPVLTANTAEVKCQIIIAQV